MRAVTGPRWLGGMILLSLLCSAAIVLTRLSDPNDAMPLGLADRLPLTTIITLAAPALSGLLGVGFGLVWADRDTWNDRALRVFVLAGFALCLSWVAIVGALWFAIGTELGPLAAGVPAGDAPSGTRAYLLIPAVALAFGATAAIAVNVRATARRVSREGFLQTMRSRGLPTTAIVARLTLRRAALPICAVLATELIVGYSIAVAVQAVLVNPSLAAGIPATGPVDVLPVVLSLGLLGATGLVIAGAAAASARFGGPVAHRPPSSDALRGAAATLLDDPAERGASPWTSTSAFPTLPSASFRSADFLDVRGLRFTTAGTADAPRSDGISLTVPSGEALAVIGDEESGAATLCLAIAGLLPANVAIRSGSILVDGSEIVGLPERYFGRLRGHQIGYLAAPGPHRLDPRARLGRQVMELLARQGPAPRATVRQRAVELFARMGIDNPAQALHAFPHQVSAETTQRVLLAGALALEPRLLIAHEPTQGFDAQATAAFLDLLHAVQREAGFALIVASADVELAVRCDRVAVMRAGTVAQYASAADFFSAEHHPPAPLVRAEDDAAPVAAETPEPAPHPHRDAEPSAQA